MAVRCVAALNAPPLHVTSSAVTAISRTEKAATFASVKVSEGQVLLENVEGILDIKHAET